MVPFSWPHPLPNLNQQFLACMPLKAIQIAMLSSPCHLVDRSYSATQPQSRGISWRTCSVCCPFRTSIFSPFRSPASFHPSIGTSSLNAVRRSPRSGPAGAEQAVSYDSSPLLNPRKQAKGRKGDASTGPHERRGAINTAGGHAAVTPFPKLMSLLLENLDFTFAVGQYGVLYHVIACVLRQRRENNMPLNVLGLDHCVITPDRAKGLKRYVQELRWDSDEGTPKNRTVTRGIPIGG